MPPRDFPYWAKPREAQGGHIVISFLFFTFPFLFLTFFTSTSPISFLIDISVFIFHFSVFVFNVLIFTSLFCFSVEIPVFILKILLFVFVSNLLIFTDLFFSKPTKTDRVDHHALLEDEYGGSRCPSGEVRLCWQC